MSPTNFSISRGSQHENYSVFNWVRILVPQFSPLTSEIGDSGIKTRFSPVHNGSFSRFSHRAYTITRHIRTHGDGWRSTPLSPPPISSPRPLEPSGVHL